ncbi:uncharacterized protein LOC129912129 [Episyrphus balteatus]|uniref:uncharacterized protein LOC129912129 n=1 Tax=Episyrphus balteatus TaxID=286459 RepID=UPI002486081D|nr:uncharacterized protein LOC129912129 [Episyrphus balteatus]XP_055846231.1 uncharacterized protein LOC129912129 [Episyrphus balteatus]XP_055846232.1 uncharacterized protein LOC129912129 [Episyrphus balteatus]XP_055846233.1 uncharacterized protein LOC129912129 [Episyrphus balteatus]
MYRTEDQEYACRQIEDVHNYSKRNRYVYCNKKKSASPYSNNQVEKDDDEEDDHDEKFNRVDYEQLPKYNLTTLQLNVSAAPSFVSVKNQSQNKKQELMLPDVVKIENETYITPPDHHARRPMNAFLIFCKRHRAIVKEKYKNYENRSITKILGEWWASLDTNAKKCYVNLAKQNKDAFFSANPNFKWYKLPAPSLRTLQTRPGNIEREVYQCEIANSNMSHNPIPPCDISKAKTKKVSYFKLADEAQMGGLNNLIFPSPDYASKNDILQNALSDGSKYFSTGNKQTSSIIQRESLNFISSHSGNCYSSSEDDVKPKKSVRSCKGKKYQEFINSGQLSPVTSKKLISPKPSTKLNCSENKYFVMHIDKCSNVIGSSTAKILEPDKDAQSWVVPQYRDSNDFNKQQFGFVSFDLENKISRLPAQCLETYLQRKKNMKHKKKLNSKKSSALQAKIQERILKQTQQRSLYKTKTDVEAKEQMVGSQKRKARKESITRRDITSIHKDVQKLLGNSIVTTALVVGSPETQPAVDHNASSDLLILAEVAANRTETSKVNQ